MDRARSVVVVDGLLDPKRDPERFRTSSLGEPTVRSPLRLSNMRGDFVPHYVSERERVLHRVEFDTDVPLEGTAALEKAGPREIIYFDPRHARAGIVTAGGVCPGINNVIRSLVLTLEHQYQVPTVLGFRFGFAGLDPSAGAGEPLALGPEQVQHAHSLGGTMLGTSRGPHDVAVMVDTLATYGIDMLFTIGGDGTMRAAHAIAGEVTRRGAKISVIGVPKTIDNDIPFVDKTFGFETAVEMAHLAIDASHSEALSAANGIGLVKLMGREAGFIAATATLASHDVNLCLVPEVPFRLEGTNGVLAYLEQRLARRGHAVIVVGEGCAQELMAGPDLAPRDASGNLRFTAFELDVGEHL
ncbi:MAG TPA: ATP-dependent 6-phosphofructokinase, partial [Polyangiaceae bacterium]